MAACSPSWRFLLFFQCWLQDCSLKSQRRTQGRTPEKQKEQQWKCLKFHFISVSCSLVLICKRILISMTECFVSMPAKGLSWLVYTHRFLLWLCFDVTTRILNHFQLP